MALHVRAEDDRVPDLERVGQLIDEELSARLGRRQQGVEADVAVPLHRGIGVRRDVRARLVAQQPGIPELPVATHPLAIGCHDVEGAQKERDVVGVGRVAQQRLVVAGALPPGDPGREGDGAVAQARDLGGRQPAAQEAGGQLVTSQRNW